MEAARIVSSPHFRFSGAGEGGRMILRRGDSRICCSARGNDTLILRKEFSDSGHTQYYQSPATESGKKQKEKMGVILTEKKKMKLIRRLSKDLDLFSQSSQGDEIGSRLTISEATEVLLAELENLRTAEKEKKRKRKEEKAKSKAMMESDTSSSSSSSESSDCDEDKVVNLRRLRVNSQPQITENKTELAETKTEALNKQFTLPSTSNFISEDQRCSSGNGISSIESAAVSSTKIEVCMGGKCKKLGAPMLMEEFEREMGEENSVVVGCKCMGKCKSGPNVRVSNSVTEIQEEDVKSSVQTTANPLYIGVGLEDVAAIVANLVGENRVGEGLLAAAS